MVVPQHSSDPWTLVKSPRGFFADELISALQKNIRRGLLEEALLIAREMFETGSSLEEKLWQRLQVISVEDIGLGSPQAPILVSTLYEMSARFDEGANDRWIFAAQAVRYLAVQIKDRTTDDMSTWCIHMLKSGKRLPTIPDFALDVHTRRGQELGRGTIHFLKESSRVENETPDRDERYRQEILAAALKGDWDDGPTSKHDPN